MKIKIMYPNSRGNLEFTKEEFEKLLNEAYNEGYSDGKRNQNNSYYTTVSTPAVYYRTASNTTDHLSDTTATSYSLNATSSDFATSCNTNGISIADVCSVKGELTNEV